ncbi:MAG: FHA domain-containing protein [Thermoleophilia bacterium]|nr:FHA domain-containing protein [Thermoleophilia bacterium]MDH4347157.1 FHA domain-containing protein [Thermoleophilia bacterium]MDH5334134.1 FHA domain-containing protein [Thermoleophilia bacterium]
MSVLRTIESKIEGLFEGVFGRAFRTHVQPVELARKLAKEMDEHRSVSVSRVYVPNEYTVYLSPGDREQFSSYEASLVGELQEYLVEHARREGYSLLTAPKVTVTTDADLAIGEFGIATRVVEPEPAGAALPGMPEPVAPAATPAPPAPAAAEPVVPAVAPPVAPAVPAATAVYRPAPAEPDAADVTAPVVRERVTLTVDGRAHPVETSRVVLGRSRECDVRVRDANVSRRHCEVVQDGAATWLVVDLGSTNGTELNGRRVTRAELTAGDRITLGATEVVFDRVAT